MATPYDGVIQLLKDCGLEYNRENYIKLNWAGVEIDEWTWEHEEELPPDLREPPSTTPANDNPQPH
jgi:hypothetical protein